MHECLFKSFLLYSLPIPYVPTWNSWLLFLSYCCIYYIYTCIQKYNQLNPFSVACTYVYVFRTDCLWLNDLSGVHPLEKNDFLSLSSCYLPVALPLGVEPVGLPSSTLDINCYCLYADLAWKILRFHGYSSLPRRCLAVNILVLCPLKSFLLPLPQCSLSLNCRSCIPVSERPPLPPLVICVLTSCSFLWLYWEKKLLWRELRASLWI